MSVIAGPSEQLPAAWIAGAWVLCEDPDNSPKELMQFNPDGTGSIIRAKGDLQFLYKASGNSVSLLADVNGHAIPIALSAASDLQQLRFHSNRTGNTAIYVKSDGPRVGTCSVK